MGPLDGLALSLSISILGSLIAALLLSFFQHRDRLTTGAELWDAFSDAMIRGAKLAGILVGVVLVVFLMYLVLTGIGGAEEDSALAYTRTRLNLREGPNADATITLTLEAGEQLQLMPASRHPWRKVRDSQGNEGWVHGAYLAQSAPDLETAKPPLTRRGTDDLTQEHSGWVRIPDHLPYPGWEDTAVSNLHANCKDWIYEQQREPALADWIDGPMRKAVERICRQHGKIFSGRSRCRNEKAEILCAGSTDLVVEPRAPACDLPWSSGAVWLSDTYDPKTFEVRGYVKPRTACYKMLVSLDGYTGRANVEVRNGVAHIEVPVREVPEDPLLGACEEFPTSRHPDGLAFRVEGPADVRDIVVEMVDETCGDRRIVHLDYPRSPDG